MKTPVIVLNRPGDRGHMKAMILCDKLVEFGVKHMYEQVGDCHTVTVEESDVSSISLWLGK
jgi:hypothetical protein